MTGDEPAGPLATMDLRDFVYTVGARSPSPGGGSVSALVATMVSSFQLKFEFFNVQYYFLIYLWYWSIFFSKLLTMDEPELAG